ncbi:adenylate/guanylate cyclase domain-containing protein [Aestuariibacter sp. GS-14]|uniref:CHASE2 domain-containing protein n=1 Tax=Aestuariibacter sp. GS-14 TaxID=2590670 RepID=UPI00112C360A|nr:adenylate/guanylate cyclase domain-containing protein [Aestuariibacter sp. GS-14]TPV62237.1 adenylate/guanylate cyclase domain-containing protein [Aestuariibacter sp. GS-14]
MPVSRRSPRQYVKWITPVAMVIGIILFAIIQWSPIAAPRERVDGLLYDLKIRFLPPWPDTVTNVQIVDIDELSLSQVGRMPWSRERFAQLVDALTAQGAVLIVMDILFAEPQPNGITHLLGAPQLQTLSEAEKQSLIDDYDFDSVFAQSLGGSEVVLPVLLHRDADPGYQRGLKTGILQPDGLLQNTPDLPVNMVNFSGYAGVWPLFNDVALGQGFMNAFEDPDGFVRRGALVASVDGVLVPSLALDAFRVYSLADTVQPLWEVSDSNAYLTKLLIGNQTISTDEQGRILIPYRGKARTYQYTSAVHLLTNTVQDNRFDQAVVFVGTSATGLADLRSTPVELGFPGVEIQATLFDALANPSVIPVFPDWWREAILLQLLILGILTSLLLRGKTPIMTSLLALLIILTAIGGNILVWIVWQISLPLFSPILLSVMMAFWYISRGFFHENRQRRQVKAIFDTYVPPAHIDQILAQPDAWNLEGEKKELTVLFSDIRGFTSISETMTASELKQWLNEFFSPITRAILEHEGTIDKYVGDMVMAFWGAPLTHSMHASQAVKAGFAMLEALKPLNDKFRAAGRPTVEIGIGINTGEMNVGDMGSDFRRSYTVIGDAVNLGSRLEGLTKFYGVSMLVSEFTQAQCPEQAFLTVDRVRVKGKAAPVTLYSPVSSLASVEYLGFVKAYNQIMEWYFAREFLVAYQHLTRLENNTFNPVLVTMLGERLQNFIQSPPPENWDGAYTHTHK